METDKSPDIFISYAHEDRDVAQLLADHFATKGWHVFWDATLRTGETWPQKIGTALAAAKCVVVLWTPHSITSNWVRDEADAAGKRGILLPVVLDHADIPLGFRSYQTLDLSDWNRGTETEDFRRLLSDVEKVISGDNPAGESDTRSTKPTPPVSPWKRHLAFAAIALLPILIVVAIYYGTRSPGEPEREIFMTGVVLMADGSAPADDVILSFNGGAARDTTDAQGNFAVQLGVRDSSLVHILGTIGGQIRLNSEAVLVSGHPVTLRLNE